MSTTNGLTDPNQPQTEEELQLIFEEVFKGAVEGAIPSDRKLNSSLKGLREEASSDQSPAAVEEPQQTEVEAASVETAEGTKQESVENTDQSEVAIKPEDYKAALEELEKLRQKVRSEDGRQAALQRELKRARDEAEALKRTKPQPQADVKQKPKEDDDSDWKALVEADPALARLIERRENALKEAIAREADERIRNAVEPVYQQQSEDYSKREYLRLKQAVPNVDEIMESDQYAKWYYAQDPYVQKLANESAEGAYQVLEWYKDTMERLYPQTPAKTPEQPKPKDEKIVKLEEQRANRVASTGVGKSQVPTKPQEELDPDALFKKVFDDALKANKPYSQRR